MYKAVAVLLLSLTSFSSFAAFCDGKILSKKTLSRCTINIDELLGANLTFGATYVSKIKGAMSGYTLRAGFGEKGNKINMGYTQAIIGFKMDYALSYAEITNPDINSFKKGVGLEVNLDFIGLNLMASTYQYNNKKYNYIGIGYAF